MKEEKLQALISLLDDPDQAVFEIVEEEILKEKSSIIKKLEQIWETTLDELIQTRIENLIQQIQYRETSKRIKNWSKQENIDLFDGFFLISQYQYPELKKKSIKNKIRQISNDIWLEINNRLTSIEKITVLNHIFYDTYKFSVNIDNIESPKNNYINEVLDTKKGNPISLAILYTLIARELGFPIQLIDFPRNPLLAYIDPETAQKAHGEEYDSPVLFYINPSNKGAIIGKKEIEFFLKRNEKSNDDAYYQPCEDKVIIKKLIERLIEAYESEGSMDKAEDLSFIVNLI